MAKGKMSRKSIVGPTKGTTAGIGTFGKGATTHGSSPSNMPSHFHPQARQTAVPRKK